MSRNIFMIEQGQFGLAVVNKTASGYLDSWQAPGGKTAVNVLLSDYGTDAAAWTCQITSGALVATPDTTTTDTPATWCEAGETTPAPGKTTYEFTGTFLQDANVVTGLNRYLFEHDTAEAYIYAGFSGVDPPRMIGRCRLASGTIGGDARVTLTADLSLPLTRKPDVNFGNATTSHVVEGAASEMAAARADAAPGDTFPADSDITAQDSTNAAKLAGEGFVANPITAWTTGQKITIGTYQFNWSGSAWAAGAHA
jgi:hypothetical protein